MKLGNLTTHATVAQKVVIQKVNLLLTEIKVEANKQIEIEMWKQVSLMVQNWFKSLNNEMQEDWILDSNLFKQGEGHKVKIMVLAERSRHKEYTCEI